MGLNRVLNIEDDIIKHMAICRELKNNGIKDVDHANNAEEGIAKVINASQNNEPYDLLVLDMHFPVQGVDNAEAGMHVLQKLKERHIELPVIICSSMRLAIPGVIGCIYYHKSQDLNWDMKELLDKLKAMDTKKS